MQSSLTSSNHLDPKFIARGASLLAHQLGHKNTNVFRASILALLEGRQSPLSPTQLGMVEDILTSPLGARALNELNHVKYCDFDQKREEHDRSVADLLKTATENYTTDPHQTSETIRALLKDWENGPVPHNTITSQHLWDNIKQKQIPALKAHRLRQFLESVEQWKTELIDVFSDEGALRFDPQNLVLAVVNERWDAVMGNQIIYGLRPTWKPGHVFSQNDKKYAVCVDIQGRENILQFSNRDMNGSFGPMLKLPERFLHVIPAKNIIETRDLKTYTGAPVFFAHFKESYGGGFVLASSLSRMTPVSAWNLSLIDVAEDHLLIYDNGSSASLSGTKIVSLKTGQELEVRDSDGVITIESDNGTIRFDEKRWLWFDGETPNGKYFSERIGWWLGAREITLSQLVQTWKKVALKETGRKM